MAAIQSIFRAVRAVIEAVATILLLWALAFGVTFDRKHYSLSCDSQRGIEVMGLEQ